MDTLRNGIDCRVMTMQSKSKRRQNYAVRGRARAKERQSNGTERRRTVKARQRHDVASKGVVR